MSVKNDFFIKHQKYGKAIIVAGLSVVFGFFTVALSIFSRILFGVNEALSFIFLALGGCSFFIGLSAIVYMAIYFVLQMFNSLFHRNSKKFNS